MISYTGTSASYTALVYVIFRRTGSNAWVAVALLLTLGVKGAITPLAGALGDRFDRRRVMIASDLLGAAALAAMALTHAPWLLLAFALIAVVVEAPFFPASGAALPNLVAPDDLAWANGTIAFGSSVGYVVGPAVGGLLVAAGGAATAFLLDALSFVVSAALVATVRGSFSQEKAEVEDHAHHGVRAGLVFMLRDPILRRVTFAFAVFAVAVGSVLVAEPPLAASFGAGAIGFGLLSTSFDLGALVGALHGRRLTEATEMRWLVGGNFVTAFGLGAVAFMPAFPPVLVAMLIAGSSDGLVDVIVNVVFQRRSPDAVRSRVMAALESMFLMGLAVSFPFGAMLVGRSGRRPRMP
jgi:MFS family permease